MKPASSRRYAPSLREAIRAGVTRTRSELAARMPLTAAQVERWLAYLAGSQDPANYYLRHPDLPMFLFPTFLEKGQRRVDRTFLRDRVYSTINGFYYIRLLDDVTDHHDESEVTLLPALGFFHTEFQSPYHIHFAAEHPFWDYFRRVWFHSADVTMADLQLKQVNRRQFVRIAAHKTCAVKIPLAATAFKYGRQDELAGWSRFMDAYGCWHQMANDLFHWHEDLTLNTATYFLSEAGRRKRAGETIAGWVTRKGFAWGMTLLEEWMAQAQVRARELDCAELRSYLDYRSEKTRREAEETWHNLQAAGKLADLLFS